jgi:hypothetical protein
VQKKSLAQISERPDSSSEVARQWLVKFGAIVGQLVAPEVFNIWVEELSDIPADRLHFACDRLMKIWRYPNLPLPGDVRAQIDNAETKGLELEAETEWQSVLDGIHWSRPRRFSAATEHAIRAAGGLRHIERCSESELAWCRKTFLAAYKNVHETGQVEYLLENSNAKENLARLVAGPPEPKRLSPAVGIAGIKPSREEAVLKKEDQERRLVKQLATLGSKSPSEKQS